MSLKKKETNENTFKKFCQSFSLIYNYSIVWNYRHNISQQKNLLLAMTKVVAIDSKNRC